MRTSIFYVTGPLVLILLILHQSSSQFSTKPSEDELTRERFNFFDLELLKALASSEKGNLLVSPVSVKAALAMVLEGAGGKSAKELREALRLTDDVKDTRIQFRNFLSTLQVNTPGTKVEAANQIFLSQTIAPQSQYETMLKTHYYSNIEKVDFTKPAQASQAINRWVNMLTHGLIPTLVEPGSLSSNTKLMLANAIYFKGKWKNSFDYDKTTVKCFYVDLNVCLDTYSMESVNVYRYAYIPSLSAQAVELAYEGDKFSLMLLLPTRVSGIQQLVRDLTHISLHNIVSSLKPTELLITVPRFKIDYDTDLLDKLNDLGIEEIFTPHANLSGMVQWENADLHISNVLHKAIIDVNEEGTVAAASTGTIVVPLMGTALPKLNFNHPFLFFLRNTESGDILFAGRLSQPDEVKPPTVGSQNGSPSSVQTGVMNGGSMKPQPDAASNTTKPAILQAKPNSFSSTSRNVDAHDGLLARMKPYPETLLTGSSKPQVASRVGQYIPYAPVPTQQNLAVTNNSGYVKYKSISNETPQILTSDNQGYNDRIHFT